VRVQVVDTGRFVREDALELGKGLRRRQVGCRTAVGIRTGYAAWLWEATG
jgi:hypothetical protein